MIHANSQQTPSSRPARRRNPRAINSCLECRERKSKCSKTYPCESCVAYGRDCVFIKDTVETEHRKRTHSHATSPISHGSNGNHGKNRDSDQEATPPRDFEWESYQQDVVPDRDLYESLDTHTREDTPQDERDDGESMLDMVFKYGKLVVTQRIDGVSLAHYAKDVTSALLSSESIGLPDSWMDPSVPNTVTPASHVPFYASLDSSNGSRLLDGSSYGAMSSRPTKGLNLSRAHAQVLYDQYVQAVNPVAHVLHMPSFKRMFDEFWSNQSTGRHNSESSSALIWAVCMSAGMSMPSMQVMLHFQTSLDDLVRSLQDATENALRQANCLATSSITTLQALTIYLIAQCRSEVLRSHSALVGALIRLAQGIGIHHNASASSLNQLHRHTRSLLWYNICILDVKTAEAMGVQPLIRADDFDVPLPLNTDDTFLDVPSSFTALSVRAWTDTTFALIRFECNELHRLIFRGSIDVSHNALTLHQLKSNVEAHKARISSTYIPLLDPLIPTHRYASLVLKLLMARCDTMLLSRLLPKTARSPSESRLRDILIPPALTTLEIAATLETHPDYAPFAWFAGAFQQYSDIIFLLCETYRSGSPPLPSTSSSTPSSAPSSTSQSAIPPQDLKRISTLISHVFGHCYALPLHQRSGIILHALKSALERFSALRRVSSSSSTSSHPHTPTPLLQQQQPHSTPLATRLGGSSGENLSVLDDGRADRDIMIQWDDAARPGGGELETLLRAYPDAGYRHGGVDLMGGGGAGGAGAGEPMDGIYMPGTDGTAAGEFGGQTPGVEWMGTGTQGMWPGQGGFGYGS
ncbi:hypothetical protein EJ05DRAFT_435648 [Pseudovirgaria hyperparasitica]|uniref:Zn(2)-C6 fungal-type domain-containing protein n=1 Tax=Pseudovirgaria hyperparasitica TaxID=470096 RepID=A0A6A6WGH8_9PEZI|nr:uncharacterized protein EJ05DRAFT_435648 [Pseudovirgaria hyperparasitica]KAF2760737.1 hypothetical protein EJ05DRAFT_435648 [Pseudovirgaria hyperparasitica]